MNVGDALARARTLGVERLEAQWLLERALGRPRSWIVAHPEAPIDDSAGRELLRWLDRRADGEPIPYLLGEQPFGGLLLKVDPRVLVPRADTELLVGWAVERLGPMRSRRVIDLGCGSGAVALGIAHACPQADILATDIDPGALEVARANARRLGLAVGFEAGDWWQAAGERRFDLAVSNPPYIALGDPHLPALRHEPVLALVSGADGLDAIRAIVRGAPAGLVPGGALLVEHGFEQAPAVRALLAAGGFAEIVTRRDEGGRERCTGGVLPRDSGVGASIDR